MKCHLFRGATEFGRLFDCFGNTKVCNQTRFETKNNVNCAYLHSVGDQNVSKFDVSSTFGVRCLTIRLLRLRGAS
jgi:hypothetical protein